MSDKERPLPRPSSKPFGARNNFEHQEEPSSLLADRMSQAAAEGKLDEFLKKEMPDNEHARNLASMMMGMTGMIPGVQTRDERQPVQPEATAVQAEIPEDVQKAIRDGDLQGLMGMLRREYQKRNPDTAAGPREETEAAPAGHQPAIDRETIDALVSIASENGLSLDWMILRAIKVYVQEYQKTGKL